MLREIFEELSGMNLSQADGSTTFLEMGFDSLFLTQVTQSLQSKFGLKITFRQLLGDESSLGALADTFMTASFRQTFWPRSPRRLRLRASRRFRSALPCPSKWRAAPAKWKWRYRNV